MTRRTALALVPLGITSLVPVRRFWLWRWETKIKAPHVNLDLTVLYGLRSDGQIVQVYIPESPHMTDKLTPEERKQLRALDHRNGEMTLECLLHHDSMEEYIKAEG